METFAGKLRKFLQSTGGAPVSFQDMAGALDLVTARDKRPLHDAVRDFTRRGELILVDISRRVYRYRRPQKAPEKREIMWRLLRARRKVSIEDLMELAGAARQYAAEWLQTLQRQGIVKRHGEMYVMLKDPYHMPRNTEKAEKLRRIRAAKKRAIEAVDQSLNTLIEARMAISDIGEEAADGDQP